jgi:hypothetical protein
MKTKLFIIPLLLFIMIIKNNAQDYHDIICGTIEDMELGTHTVSGYSAYGNPFTPKGDLRALVICAGFGPYYDDQWVNGWDSAPDSIPSILKDGSLFYTNTSQFSSNPPASAIENVSAYYYAMSRGQFRFMVDVYPKRINITPGNEGWSGAAKKVIAQMKTENPNFDWSPYDNRQNVPGYQFDNSINPQPDMKPDYVIIIYRYNRAFGKQPYTPYPPGNAYATIDLGPTDIYNGYTFNSSCGYTQFIGGSYYFLLFIHEVAHTLYNAPHVSGANGVMGNYIFEEKGWSQMYCDYLPFVSSNAWERWYLDWINGIKASGVNTDIQSASDLNASGEYILRDFITTGDAVRIKIPNGNGDNQYLWLENHQGVSIFDNQNILTDGCGTEFSPSPRGIVSYIESIHDDKNNPGNIFYSGANGIKYLHANGNFDYIYDTPPTDECWYGNDVYNLHQIAMNPISGQCDAQDIKADFNNNNKIDLDPNANSISALARGDFKMNLKRDGIFVWGNVNGERAFATGRKLSMSSNPCLINRPKYISSDDKMGVYYLNGISVTVLNYYSDGRVRIKIQYNDVDITNDTRYAGTIHLPNITGDANPDIRIMPGTTLHIDKSGTLNKSTKTSAGDFINPTEFRCLSNSFFKQSANSKVFVENGSSLIIENGATYEADSNAEFVIKSGSNLTVKSGGILTLKNSAVFSVEFGATLTVESGAIIN